jgi:hydrogenase maturation protease
VLVLGLGNRLLGDDAAGPLAVDTLVADAAAGVQYCDGGTIGLALLPAIEDAGALIAIDAARFGAEPGTVRVFEGDAMDRQLGGRKSSAHEVALADLIAAAAFSGRLPRRRALVAVEPASTELGLAPTAPVQAALPRLCHEVRDLLERWQP